MKRGTWGRRTRRAAAGLLGMIGLAGAAWLTGVPQEKAIAWAAARYLGAVAVVEWGGMSPDLRLKRLEVYPDDAAFRMRRPLLVAEDVSLSYAVFPGDGRRVKSVKVGRAYVSLDVRDPGATNFQFLIPKETDSAPGGASDPAYVPLEVDIDELRIAVLAAAGRAALGPIQLNASLTDPESPVLTYRSARATASWYASDRENIEIMNVTVDGAAKIEGDRVEWSQKLDAPGLAYTVVSAEGELAGEDPAIRITAQEFSLAGNRLAAFLDAVDAPIRFDEFDIESGEARVTLSEAPAIALTAAARVRAASMLGSAQPLYARDARIEIEAESGETLAAKATLRLAEDQTLRAEILGNDRRGAAVVTSERWTRDQLMAALPEAFRSGVEGLGFDSFAVNANVEWTEEGFVAKAQASSQGGGTATESIYWALDAHGPRDSLAGVEGKLEARLGDRSVRATGSYVGEDHYRAEARVEEVQLAPWVRLFAGDAAAEGVLGTIEGTIRAEANGKNAPLEIVPDFRLRELKYSGVELEEITLGGRMRYHTADSRLEVAELVAEAVDGMTMLRLAEFEYDTAQGRGEGDFVAGANLGIVGNAIGLPDLYGEATAEGRARVAGDDLFIECAVASGFLAVGEVLLPYGTKVNGEVELGFNTDRGDGAFTRCEAKIGDGTTVRLLNTRFTTEPFEVTGDFECDSDMQLAVAFGWLHEVEGSLTERSAFRVTEEIFEADWTLTTEAGRLLLPENAGSAEGLYFEGSGTYRDGLSGSGNVRAAKLTAAGGTVVDASGPAPVEGDYMKIGGAAGRIFGGGVTADVDVGVLLEDFPIHVVGAFDAVDLAILTDEVKPPNTSLTGTALGTLSARYTAKGLESFTFDASAPGGLSVNRSLVSDLLQSDRFLAGAGERIAGRALDKLLGTEPQRPFDTGRLHIFLDSGKILGTAELRSEKTAAYNGLNLTVNLDMDQSALAEALRVLEESNLGNVEF